MQLDPTDAAHLWDMLQAGRELLSYTQGSSYADYIQNPMLRRVAERMIEIIGEAARRVGPETRQATPQIPWPLVVAQRNVLIHAYGKIDHAKIWALICDEIPVLADQLEQILRRIGAAGSPPANQDDSP